MLSRRVAVLRLVARLPIPRASRLFRFDANIRSRRLRKVRRRVARPLVLTALSIIPPKPDAMQMAAHVVLKLDPVFTGPLLPHLPRFLRNRVLMVPVMLV